MNEKHVELLLAGATVWNEWRRDNPITIPDLANVNLEDTTLRDVNLQDAMLWGANLQDVNFTGANLQGATLEKAILNRANLTGADLRGVRLYSASLWYADFTDVIMHWFSRELIGTRLHQEAIRDDGHADYYNRIALAGAILTNPQHSWKYWLKAPIPESVKTWALDTMSQWVRDGDHAPQVLTKRVKKIEIESEE